MKYDSVLDQQSISGKIVSLILCVWKPCYVKSGHIYLQHFYFGLGVQHTIGVDQDVWYYSKSQDEPARDESSVHKLITFYTWDFAGQVSSIMYSK